MVLAVSEAPVAGMKVRLLAMLEAGEEVAMGCNLLSEQNVEGIRKAPVCWSPAGRIGAVMKLLRMKPRVWFLARNC